MIKQLLQQSKTLATHYWPGRRRQRQQNRWESLWAAPNFAPSWRIQTIPHELEEAVTQQWFSPGSHLLDIGCGSGECANWLAQKGFTVLGIDFAPSAIARAQATYPKTERLQFRVLDICQAVPEGSFYTLFDRGCLHVLPNDDRARYVQQVANLAASGARFLLLHRLIGDITKQLPLSENELAVRNLQTINRVHCDFQSMFEITQIKSIVIPRRAGKQPELDVPGLAVWLVRR